MELGGRALDWTGQTEGLGDDQSSSNEDSQGEEAVEADMFSRKGDLVCLIVRGARPGLTW